MSNKRLAKTIVTISSLIGSLSATSAAVPARPSIVIGIVVEGLSTDYLRLLDSNFSAGGFRRLAQQGVSISDLRYGPGVDEAAATAIIYTGAAPTVNGIPSTFIYQTDRQAAVHILHDPSKIGNFTSETYSPDALKVSTISDELRIDSRGEGLVHSVAASPTMAILTAGHAANGAFWISDTNNNWASSTYYTDMPISVGNRNYRAPLSQKLDTVSWTPVINPTALPGLSDPKRLRPFKHLFTKKMPDRLQAFKASAVGNREITDLAIDLINELAMGRHTGMDMINVAYTLAPYSYGRSADSSMETLDAYIRLDRDIARLIDAATRSGGQGKVAVFLAGTPAPASEKRDDARWNIPYGQFSVKKAESLLNMYLMALHGNDDWIDGYYNNQFYLNRKLISDKNLDITDIRSEAADFLTRMSGVADVYTIEDIIAARVGDDPQGLKRNTSVRHSGDIIIKVAPGWEVIDDGSRRPPVVQRESQGAIPAFILAPGIKPQKITTPTDARIIAPSVTRAIWVRAPNGASLSPLPLD